MKKCLSLLLVGLLTSYLSSLAASGTNTNAKGILKVHGTIVAFEQSPTRIAMLTSVGQREIFILRIEQWLKGKEDSKYIKVVYDYRSDKAALPPEVLQGKEPFCLVLRRLPSCDSSILDEYPDRQEGDVIAGSESSLTYLLANSAHDTAIPLEEALPCYTLQSGEFKRVASKSQKLLTTMKKNVLAKQHYGKDGRLAECRH
jgi:hypothetical protein